MSALLVDVAGPLGHRRREVSLVRLWMVAEHTLYETLLGVGALASTRR